MGVTLRCVWVVLVAALAVVACQPARDGSRTTRRAVYVKDGASLLAEGPASTRLDRAITAGTVTDVIPYGLGPVLATRDGRARVARWVREVRRRGTRVIVPIAGRDRVASLSRMIAEEPGVGFDGMVTELEYWNRPDRERALAELIALLADMRDAATEWGRAPDRVPVGAYLGYPTPEEARKIAGHVDFVFLDYAIPDVGRAWTHVRGTTPLRDRFAWFASAGVAVWPILYAAGEVDMRASLARRGLPSVEAEFRIGLRNQRSIDERQLAGFVYFPLESLPP